ncbi:ATPase [Phlyctema vagabunda]|uniref:ATPase n=1 Tax=Phlyctema vagabunda TaxID=108571 RepID=A0ABR4P501_9HELO
MNPTADDDDGLSTLTTRELLQYQEMYLRGYPLLDDWEDQQETTILLPLDTHSDDFEALQLIQEETTARKNQDGIVIQHRAWAVAEVFLSEADHLEDTPLRPRRYLNSLPSSPPAFKMPSASSPIAYPPSSSPPPLKRPLSTKPADLRKPRAVSGFLQEESSDDEDLMQPESEPHQMVTNLQRPQNPLQDPVLKTPVQPKEKTVGGFMVDEDEEDELELPSILNREPIEPAQPIMVPHTESETRINHGTLPSFLGRSLNKPEILTCSGKSITIRQRVKSKAVPFEKIVAARSTTKAGRAKKSYYGIDIHQLIDDATKEAEKDKIAKSKLVEEILPSVENVTKKPRRTLMWTEKYRARNFMELVGDDRTHRQVLRWLKAWDPIVFPKSGKVKPAGPTRPGADTEDEKQHRKILLLTGPPGLGKTTLAHVCARQAGYEVMEINASDERSRDVVKNRIRTSVGTESVKTGSTVTTKTGHVQKIAHPLCVVVDEVDGVVGGAGGSGEGGFIKALIDLVLLDQKNSSAVGTNSGYAKKKKKGDDFRLMRPLILICNDVYHPSLRPLRQSSFAEIIHIRKPPLDAVVSRMKSVFEKEHVPCDSDGVRRLCEATWGVSAMDSRKGHEGTGEGDLRGVMVVGEWAAGKLRATRKGATGKLTRKWVEENMTGSLSHGGGGTRGVGRGGVKEVVNRVFLDGAGFPKVANTNPLPEHTENQPKTQLGVAEIARKAGMDRLREMVDTSGDTDRIVTEIFSEYPNQPYNDDSILSKPDAAYEWLHFHDACSSRVFTGQDWELAPYLSQSVLACHHLFSSPARHYFREVNEPKKWGEEEESEPLPFSGPRADYAAHEAEKLNRATVLNLQANLNAMLLRSFRSPEDIATDLLPYLVKLLTPDIKPIIVGGSGDQKGIASVRKEAEKAMVKRAVDVMGGVGVLFERGKLEGEFGSRATQWVYRMEPPLDTLVIFETAPASASAPAPVRYAVRQVLDQEYQKNIIVRENAARQARYKAGNPFDDTDYKFSASSAPKDARHQVDVEKVLGAKRDFFGRVINEQPSSPLREADGNAEGGEAPSKKRKMQGKDKGKDDNKVWVSFHEGFSNAVRKPVTIDELLRGL